MTATSLTDGTSRPVTVRLELDVDAEPINGTLQVPGEAPHPFMGWLGLIASLHAARTQPLNDKEAQR